MFENKYVYVNTSLPPLQIGQKPDISFEEFERLLEQNLSAKDFNQVKIFRRYYDILNMRALWRGDEIQPYGNFDRNELQEAIVDYDNLPPYIINYLETYSSVNDRLKHFALLLSAFFREEIDQSKGFLRVFLNFDRNLRIVLTVLRARELGRDLAQELEFESPDDDLIVQLMSVKDAKQLTAPPLFQWLQPIFEKYYKSPLEMQKAIVEFQFNRIEDMIGLDVFSLDRILGYMAQLIMVEQWLKLDQKTGKQIVDNILKESS